MLRVIQNRSPEGAKKYFEFGDYLAEGIEGAGIWRGKGAQLLGLSGQIEKDDFDSLCDNQDPRSGEKLTQRTKSDRTVGYDFNFSAPKSVSLAHALTGDGRIADAFRETVYETMLEVETEAKTRVRKKGENHDRVVGNLVWAEYLHLTSRPVDGIPDPHLHAHCFTFNTVFDNHADEQRWKAGQFRDLKRDAPYYEAAFQSRFAIKLKKLGYAVERRGKSFELIGVSQGLVDRFSRRTQQIEALAKAKGITNPEEKADLGAKTRQAKSTKLTLQQLVTEWRSWLSDGEKELFRSLLASPENITFLIDATSQAMKHAKDHCFERASVVPAKRLLERALRFGVGDVGVEDVKRELVSTDVLFGERDGQQLSTTREVLREEQEMLRFARDSRGTLPALNAKWQIQRDWLNDGQKHAIIQLLCSSDRVQIVKGRAGTGKTTLMIEAIAGMEAGGVKVYTFAPSTEASKGVLREKGFATADTVARLLVDTKLQDQVAGHVLWIDEAGLLGTKTLGQVFELAKQRDCRVILSGDWTQHGSVERGAAMRLLGQSAGLKIAEINNIQRQKHLQYREIVDAISKGKLIEGFDALHELTWIKEYELDERPLAVAKEYADSIDGKETTLVVSPTHFEGDLTTEAIRQELKKRGRIAKKGQRVQKLEPRNLTEAERRDAHNYKQGDVIVFQQNAIGHVKGERITIEDKPDANLLDHAARFQVFHPAEIELSKGDLIRFTANGATLDQEHRLNNGATYHLAGFTNEGDIQLDNGWVVSKDYGRLSHGYVITSHASQGKSVDHVILAQSSYSLGASSKEQWYVSVSRGEQRCTVITDDAEALKDAVQRSDERLTATEFVLPDSMKRARELSQRHALSLRPHPLPDLSRQPELAHDR